MSGISYKLLKLIFKHDNQFLLDVINDIMNDRVNTEFLSQMIVIPIRKKNKISLEKCEAWRMICLGDTLEKITQKCFIALNVDLIEENMGHLQFA